MDNYQKSGMVILYSCWLVYWGKRERLIQGPKRTKVEGSSLYVERLVILFALTKSVEAGFSNLQIESDCKEVLIDGLHGKGFPEIQGDVLIEDIINVARIANCKNFTFVSRNANRLADSLSKFLVDKEDVLCWIEGVPRSAKYIRLSDVWHSA